MESVYQLEQVKKEYAGRVVLDIERLDIESGQVLALVGPSGAGKSTLLRLLNFLEPPSAGKLLFRGRALEDNQVPLALRREVTTVFQRPVLLGESVYHNVEYGLRLRGERVNGQVTRMLEQVGLQELARANARQISGGEMQRVALARALVIEPAVLLLDEPTANLDPYNVALIEDIVRRRNQTRGTTIVLVTHNIFQAKRLAQRVGLMLGGRLVEIAETSAFFENPTNPQTRAFLQGDYIY
jgi:tungstate transport system ATP-binding protein